MQNTIAQRIKATMLPLYGAFFLFSLYSAPATSDTDASTSRQPLWAVYATIGGNDDGDIDHPELSLSSNGDEHVFDMGDPAHFCPADAPYFCVWGDIFRLAVPRHKLKPKEKWHFGGYSFAVVPHQTNHPPAPPPPPGQEDGSATRLGNILGQVFIYTEIAARRDGDKNHCLTVYLFSNDLGLVGVISPPCKGQIVTWNYLEQRFGPGAPEFDANIPAEAFMTKDELAQLMK